MPLALGPKVMESGGQRNRTREPETGPEPEPGVDAAPTAPVDFEPPVKDWIEYLAGRLARDIIRESEGTGA